MTHFETHFDMYGKIAEQDIDDTCQNGRYAIQKDAETNIPADIIKKLKINSKDNFLDIGCGLGLTLGPVSKITNKVVGCDHEKVIEKTRQRVGNNIDLIGGNFLDIKFNKKFDKILAYSVLPALPDEQFVFDFIDKALLLMTLSGRMLLGDLANKDKKMRFTNSKRGQEFQKQWDQQAAGQNDDEKLSSFSEAGPTVVFDDALILKIIQHIRKKGFHAYVVDQPQRLPFGNSREDILVVGPEYDEGDL